MNKQFSNKQFPMGNPFANVLVVVVGTLVMAASLVLGVVAFIALGGLMLVLAAIIGIRIWWLNRKLGKSFAAAGNAQGEKSGRIEIIEGEYRVVSRRDSNKTDPEA